MASSSRTVMIALLAVLVVVLPTLTGATEFVVGGDDGWALGVNYTDWAQGKEFHVGDTLVFKYAPGSHNVFKVSGPNFKACNVPPANEAMTSGNDVITLTSPGRRWYICGVGDGAHCEGGQKLVITVLPAEGLAPSAPPTAVWPIVPAPSPTPTGWGSLRSYAPVPAPVVGGETPIAPYFFFNRFLKY